MSEGSEMHDLVIRGGTVIDGTGSAPFLADVAVDDGAIVMIGAVVTRGRQEIDAADAIVTPGFIDVHTHYDGQATWTGALDPSSSHGVTTVVTGNCGVGFAPCRPEDREALVALMAGVEDIPEAVMAEGLPWTWQSFSEYLDAVDRLPHDVDIAAMVPHSALRVFVMGDRAIRREIATAEDIAEMASITRDAMNAGAVGFGTSRALQQRSISGEPIPTVRAAEAELLGILSAMTAADTGVFQLLSDFGEFDDIEGEFAMLRRLVEATGRPTSFTVNQKHSRPDTWRQLLELTRQAADDGLPIRAQVLGRPTGVLLGHELTATPFDRSPTYAALRTQDFSSLVDCLRDVSVRQKILAETSHEAQLWDTLFELTDPPDYEPMPSESIFQRSRRSGLSPEEVAYDIMLNSGGRRMLLRTLQNYAAGSLDACYEMLTDPVSVLGLGDGGAHCGLICDASFPSTMLSLWVRDRVRGPRLDLATVVRSLTREAADVVGLGDRGTLAVGLKADINVIDPDVIRARAPRVQHDLPAGGRRLVQDADGYRATVVTGTVTRRDGHPTGARPGRVVRGAQRASQG